MFDRTVLRCLFAAPGAFMLRLPRRAQLFGSFTAGALVSGALLAFAVDGQAVRAPVPAKPARAATEMPFVVAPQSQLDLLRNAAASGDEFSNWALSKALLDKFDSTGNSDDLYEALVWVDRRWDVNGKDELAGRVVDRYCGQRVVRWHRLCVLGE